MKIDLCLPHFTRFILHSFEAFLPLSAMTQILISSESEYFIIPFHHLAVHRRTVHSTDEYHWLVFRCLLPMESQLTSALCSASLSYPAECKLWIFGKRIGF